MRPRIIIGVAGIAALVVLARFTGLGARDDTPTITVTRARFLRTVTAEGTLRAARATPITAPVDPQQPYKIAWLIDDGTHVQSGEVIARFDPTDLEKELADGLADRGTASEKTAKASAQAETTRRNLDRDAALAGGELANARAFQAKDTDLHSRFEIISSEIDATLAERRQTHAEAVRTTRGELFETELDLLAIEQRKAGQKTEKAEKGLRALALTAPHGGIVVLQRDFRGDPPRVGETCWPGEKLAEIPDLAVMEAEVFVLEADAGGLATGQHASITVEGKAGEFSASVRQVDAIAKPRQRNAPVQYFSAVLDFACTDPAVMKPGARVTATIVLADEERALTVPRQAVFERDGRKIVYRKRRWGSFTPVEVSLGASALGRALITSGLREGDAIAVVDPTRPRATPTPGAAAAPHAGAAT